jgi:hypothetical protein
MTNPIGSGTINITINVPSDERGFWSRLVDTLGFRSANELQRLALERGLEAIASDFATKGKPEVAAKASEAAKQLHGIRRQYYGAAMLVIFGLMLAGVIVAKQDIRARQKTARRRNDTEFALEV